MQKLVYLSNSRDYTEQGNINENKYFSYVNSLLDQGWKVSHIAHHTLDPNGPCGRDYSPNKETLLAVVLLEKENEEE